MVDSLGIIFAQQLSKSNKMTCLLGTERADQLPMLEEVWGCVVEEFKGLWPQVIKGNYKTDRVDSHWVILSTPLMPQACYQILKRAVAVQHSDCATREAVETKIACGWKTTVSCFCFSERPLKETCENTFQPRLKTWCEWLFIHCAVGSTLYQSELQDPF